jgi:hypothetical protein
MMQEIWKDIPEYEGIYQASTFGRIRTVEGKITHSVRHGIRHWKSRILKGRGNQPEGARVSLWKDKQSKDFLVARLVARTFLGEPPEGFTVNHIDGNRFNNRVNNLEWLSRADNIRHGFETGLYPTQKNISIVKDGKQYDFRSLCELDRFLHRAEGYTSNRMTKHNDVIDINGNIYQII